MVLVLGPFFGSFEYEITTFRPYITWLNDIIPSDVKYVSTHFNRLFMYNNITHNHIPIYKHLSRNELEQEGSTHNSFSYKDFNTFLKDLKYEVFKRESCSSKKDIDIKNIGYAKTPQQYPIYKKIFNKIECSDIPEDMKGLTLFIPYGKQKDMMDIYCRFNTELSVIGNMGCSLPEHNVLLRKIDYPENCYKYIVGMITYAKAVICPLSYWTLLCNMQGTKVFSWGKNPEQYRKGGIYNIDNNNATIFPAINGNILINSLEMFFKGL